MRQLLTWTVVSHTGDEEIFIPSETNTKIYIRQNSRESLDGFDLEMQGNEGENETLRKGQRLGL